MSSNAAIDLNKLIDEAPIGVYRLAIFVVCGLIALIDGFDTQSIAFAAPAIAAEWVVPTSLFGVVFGAGLIGGTVGAILLGSAGDRFGRRQILLATIIIFAAMSFATAHSHSIQALVFWRFMTGMGLGGAVPSIIAIASEYAPRRLRATVITCTFCNFPLGAVLGGLASARLLDQFGWRSIFLLGAAAPLLLLPIVFLLIPESISMLVAKQRLADLVALVRRIDPQHAYPSDTQFLFPGHSQERVGLRELLRTDLRTGTLLLWLGSFTSLLLAYFLINWTPLLLRQSGMAMSHAIYAVVLLNLGSIIGSIVLSQLGDRFGLGYVVPPAFVAGALAVVFVSTSATSPVMVMIAVFLAGMFCVGSQVVSIALIAIYYPSRLCATGVGWTMGVGRIGSIVGPGGAGLLVAGGLGAPQIFLTATIPALIAAAAVFGVGAMLRRQATT